MVNLDISYDREYDSVTIIQSYKDRGEVFRDVIYVRGKSIDKLADKLSSIQATRMIEDVR